MYSNRHTIEVQVTQQDIDNGTNGDTYQCPIALAINRAASDLGPVMVNALYMSWKQANKTVNLPPVAAMWMLNYDMGIRAEMAPFEFKILI